jgi:HPt (histidine-containing phosphotransfer) domain-containing protein
MTESPAKQKLSQVLKELKAEYLIKLPQRILLLKSLTEQNQWTCLEEEYHKLKGTGKTYGFPEISTVCERLEQLTQKSETRNPEIFAQAVLLLERMHQSYLHNEPIDLTSDPFARSLLALPPK